jgi:hypothetical protein
MNKTAVIMSHDEAMALPVEKRPICYRISSEMYHAVFEAVGAASMCWKPRPSSEVFDPEAAEKIAVELCFKIAHERENLPPTAEKKST